MRVQSPGGFHAPARGRLVLACCFLTASLWLGMRRNLFQRALCVALGHALTTPPRNGPSRCAPRPSAPACSGPPRVP